MILPLEYLSHLNSSVIRLGLDPVKKLLASLRNPQDDYASLLIGGTNGKGSIAATAAAILREAGYRVGLYTSPHLVDLRERICVDGEMISSTDLDRTIDEVRGQVREDVTYFEFLTAVAFLYFSRRQVDVAVLEVGLGGRLDATNVVKPAASVISNISLEHQDYLGKRLSDIAREKGGIIPEGGVCITAAKQKAVLRVLEAISRERRARLYKLGRDIRVRRQPDGSFSYRGIGKNYSRLSTRLRGRHQIENTALALAALELLAGKGLAVSDVDIIRGLQKTRWEGRLEILQPHSPQLIVDGGHNPAGIAVLCRSLQEDFSYSRLILVFGVLSDKNFPLMVRKIAPLAELVILTRPESERAVPPAELEDLTRLYCNRVEVLEQPRLALRRALELARRDDLICCAGSLYLVGDIKKAFVNNS